MSINIGISEENSLKGASLLNKLLSDEYVLYTKTRKYHWNVKGTNFMELHKFFEDLYDEQSSLIDDLAERVRSLGYAALGSLSEFLQQTSLKEGGVESEGPRLLENLLQDHETVIREIRELVPIFDDKLGDAGNADFLTGIMEKHEKWAWFLRSYLGK